MTHRGLFQPLAFSDSVILWCSRPLHSSLASSPRHFFRFPVDPLPRRKRDFMWISCLKKIPWMYEVWNVEKHSFKIKNETTEMHLCIDPLMGVFCRMEFKSFLQALLNGSLEGLFLCNLPEHLLSSSLNPPSFERQL